ncbi:MAG: hypothetical protein LBV44_04300 [Methylobacillus sp.]|jgi:hypothetical protein|nr:hypothetical protein [Methylobacillus sp.]
MNQKTLTIILLLQTVIIVALCWMLVLYGKDEYAAYSQQEQEENIASKSHVSTEQGATVVTLAKDAQTQSGIVVSALQAADWQATQAAFGAVVDLAAYNDLRARWLAARAEADVARASLANTRREYQRLAQLNQDDRNVSDRAVSAAEAAWKADEARLAAAETAAASARDTLRQQWGETLTNWATQGGEPLQRLLQNREVLVQITLPPDAQNPDTDATLMVTPVGTQGQALRATFVSVAPQTDAVIQGKTYFYRVAAGALRVGMRLQASLSQQNAKAVSGVIVPFDAVVWYGGSAWVYVKQSEERFARRQISTERESGNGWLNTGALKAGDQIVTGGAQLLLSEEFKYQILNENED